MLISGLFDKMFPYDGQQKWVLQNNSPTKIFYERKVDYASSYYSAFTVMLLSLARMSFNTELREQNSKINEGK